VTKRCAYFFNIYNLHSCYSLKFHEENSSSEAYENRLYRTIILPVVLYECDILSRILREGEIIVVQNRMLMRIFGPKRAIVIETFRKLHD
jgi:hypothetical protein